MGTSTMTKSDLRSALVDRSGCSATVVESVLNALASVVTEQVSQGNRLQIPGLLTIDVVERAARTGRNPSTGETMQIPARRVVKVTASNTLKRAAAGG